MPVNPNCRSGWIHYVNPDRTRFTTRGGGFCSSLYRPGEGFCRLTWNDRHVMTRWDHPNVHGAGYKYMKFACTCGWTAEGLTNEPANEHAREVYRFYRRYDVAKKKAKKKEDQKDPGLERLMVLAAKIRAQKEKLADERDKFRCLVNEFVEILDSMNDGLEQVENGMDDVQRGLDRMSEYI